ncbi:hypothetical protein D3C73_1433350 [compost metagenome]
MYALQLRLAGDIADDDIGSCLKEQIGDAFAYAGKPPGDHQRFSSEIYTQHGCPCPPGLASERVITDACFEHDSGVFLGTE